MQLTVKSEGEKEFQRLLNEYAKWTKRQPMEIATAKAYFVGLQAMGATKASRKEQILAKLKAPSTTNPNVELDAILVNFQLGQKEKKGLYGEKMKAAVEKFDKKEQSRTGAARSGYIAPLKTLDFWNKKGDIKFSKRFAPKKPVNGG